MFVIPLRGKVSSATQHGRKTPRSQSPLPSSHQPGSSSLVPGASPRSQPHVSRVAPAVPDVLVVGEDDDGPGVGRLQQLPDDPVEVDALVLAVLGDLQGLGDAEPTCATEQSTKGPSEEGRGTRGAQQRRWGEHGPEGRNSRGSLPFQLSMATS